MDRRRTLNLDGKCGSCRFFVLEQGRECTGFCSGRMKQKGRIERSYKCIGYEAAPTIIKLPFDESQVNWKPITNADRIRAMTDEELADLYMKAIEDEEYPGWWGNRMGLLAWLKQEAQCTSG